MAAGVPVIATNQGGTRELIISGESGYLADPHDIETMALHATRLLSSADHWRAVSESARLRAVTHFDQDHVIDQYLAFYEKVRNEVA
jgi:glycosyltransferase involved in cell wall biosynthesis